MGFTSCHKLLIASGAGTHTQTYTHTQTHTERQIHTHTHTDICTETILRNQAYAWFKNVDLLERFIRLYTVCLA